MDDHHDDCGDDFSSLHDTTETMFSVEPTILPCEFDTDDALSDEDHDYCLKVLLGDKLNAYPVDFSKVAQSQPGEPAAGPDTRAPKPSESPCQGCRSSRARSDWEHNRVIGECRYPYDDPWVPVCEACEDRKPRSDANHTFNSGKCKWATKESRAFAPRRSSTKPHEPVPKAHEEPTAGIPANVEGRELGADGEDHVAAEEGRKAELDAPQDQGSSSWEGREAEPGAPPPPPRPARGPDHEQRVRRTYRDQGDNPESSHDWSNFDINKVVRLFRTTRVGAIRLSLRKLHTRWWHASEHTMKRFLERVGVSQKVLDLIPEIVQTCRVCREWAKPGPSNACSVELPDTFNQQVECDLLFVHKNIISTCWADALDGMRPH